MTEPSPARARSLRVCYFGTYRAQYSRNRIMIEGLRRTGAQVVECHQPLWQGIEDRVRVASGGWRSPAFWWRAVYTYVGLVYRFSRLGGDYDVLVVGYPGHFDVFLARLLSWWRRKPLVWDVFMSIYLIAVERGLDRRSPTSVALIRWLERMACRLPDRLILDTEEYVTWFGKTHGVPASRFRLVPTGADTALFQPLPRRTGDEDAFRVVYYGTFIPNHGVRYIVESACLLAGDPRIHFELIGRGPDLAGAMAFVEQHRLTNVTFVDWLDQAELMQHVAGADLCLGVFGRTPQSLMTVQNKIYEGLAMARPVLTGDGPAVRRTLRHGEHVYLCERASAIDLAEAIEVLAGDVKLRNHMAQSGHAHCTAHYSIESIGRQFRSFLDELRPSD